MDNFKKFLNNFEGYCCIFTLAAMSIIVFIQVVFRFVIKSSLPWSEEASRYLLVWTAFLGGAYGVRQGAHIGIEAFALLLPKKAQKVLNIIVMVASIVLCAVIFKFGLDIVQTTSFQKASFHLLAAIPMGIYVCGYPYRNVLVYHKVYTEYL